MKTKRWRKVDRLGGGGSTENSLNSRASGKIYYWRSRLPVPLCRLCMQTPTLEPGTFLNRALPRTHGEPTDLCLLQLSLFLMEEFEKVRILPSHLSSVLPSYLALAELFRFLD